MIGRCANSATGHRKRVVGRAAAHLGEGLPRAEADGLDSGNGKHMAGDGALHGIPPVRAAQTGGQTADDAADHAAHTVAIRFGSGSACPQSLLIQDIRVNGDMGRLQVCDRQRAGHGQRRGEPPGGMAAAPGIVAAQGADRGGIVSVGGPGLVFQAVVVGGTDITVVNDRRQRIAGSAALIDTGQEVHFLFFLPGGGQSPLPHAAQQLFTDKGLVHRQPRRHIRQQDTHRRTVGLAEKRVVHHDSSTSQFPPRAASSRQKVG